jgi:hypothetical protein
MDTKSKKTSAQAIQRKADFTAPAPSEDADKGLVESPAPTDDADKAGVNVPAPTDDADKAVVLPPDVVKAVDQFRGFLRKTAEAYVGLGETVWTVNETFSKGKQRQFCAEVGLEFEGVHYKALVKVGENAPRLKAVIDKLPDKPTTIDWLARISPVQFQSVEPHLKPESKMRELRALLPVGSTKTRAKRKIAAAVTTHLPGWLLESSGPLNESIKSQVHEELTKVSARFGLSMKPVGPATA